MLRTILFALLAVATSAAPVSSPAATDSEKRCSVPVENTPWTLENIHYFQPAAGSKRNASISFEFVDDNDGLEVVTQCYGQVSGGAAASGAGGYISCRNSAVSFQFQGGNLLMLQKAYENPCETFPFNANTAYGANNTDWVTRSAVQGTHYSMASLVVEITELVS